MSEKNKIFSFSGGYVIHQGEELSNRTPIKESPLLDRYRVSLSQCIGAPPSVIVKKGDLIKKGQLLAEAGGFVSAPIHSPTSGEVMGFTEVPNAVGGMSQAIEILSDGTDQWGSNLEPIDDWTKEDPSFLLKRVGDAGIVGMGGAAFPSRVKLSPPKDKKIDYLVVNGAECEPYLTADERLMMEEPEQVLRGVAIVAKILNVKNVIIGIEDNKKDAIITLKEGATQYDIKIVELPVRYPQGAEKQLIYSLTGRKVPTGGLPMDVGVVVQNVGSCKAIADAIDGRPLIERVTTITGEAVVNPGNWLLRIGTPIFKALEFANGVKFPPAKVIMGGPMMGFSQTSLNVTICKNSSGILVLGQDKITQYQSNPCIRCGRCVEGCPMNLLPGSISSVVECRRYDLAEQLHVMDCLECGSCAYVCPSYRPLVQHFRRAKGEILAQRRKQAANNTKK